MKEMIKKIYSLYEDNLVTPINLVGNARLENYEYVKYYQEGENLISEMKFSVMNISYIFLYYFDKNNMLQKIFCNMINKRILIFDRNEELSKILLEYEKSKTLVS